MGTIEQRLQTLERELRRSRRANRLLAFTLVTMVCIAGALGAAPDGSKPTWSQQAPSPGASRPDESALRGKDHLRTVEADQFVLLDRLGRTRARMVATEHGPTLSMFDEKGQKTLELGHTASASGLRLFDSDESPVVSLQLPDDADPAHLEIRSPQGSSLTKADGFRVRDGADQGRAQLALLNGNFPVLGISQSGQSGPPSIELTASEDGSRGLKIHDDGGHPLFSVFAANSGRTWLNMRHPAHERSLQISAGLKDGDGPSIEFFAPAKKDGGGGLLARLQFGLRKDRQPYMRIVDSEGKALFTAPTN